LGEADLRRLGDADLRRLGEADLRLRKVRFLAGERDLDE
jgi:hypothetical protein